MTWREEGVGKEGVKVIVTRSLCDGGLRESSAGSAGQAGLWAQGEGKEGGGDVRASNVNVVLRTPIQTCCLSPCL